MTASEPRHEIDRLLLEADVVLTMDRDRRVVSPGRILVEGGRIVAVGEAAVLPEGGERLSIPGGLVVPGLVQSHVHLGQTIFRGLAEGRRLLAWLRERIWPLEAAHDDDSAYWSTRLGAAECLLGGTTTVQEIGLGPGAAGLLEALVDSGLRAVAGMCLMDSGAELPDGLRGDTDRVLERTLGLGERYDGADGGRLRYSLNPRFILTGSDELWRRLRELAEERGWPLHTHALEQRDESEAVRALKGGRDEIEYFDSHGVLDTQLCLAHGVWLTERHLERLGGRRLSVAHCPSANLKLGSGIADIIAIRRAGLPVGVGADGAACNNDLDCLEEVRLAALLQALEHGPEAIDGATALGLATEEGARALGMGDEIGSLEAGKAADLVVLDGSRPELAAAASADPHDLVAFSATRAAVRHVMVGGRWQVWDGELLHSDLAEIVRRLSEHRTRLLERARL
ncbi:MAG: amidohydrolase family protein [Thermoanaerobaculia bacterium]|nr:amidohydrolase family protein [Thermoanaerobaculia bacterium]